jgi:predicted CoA-binding protein
MLQLPPVVLIKNILSRCRTIAVVGLSPKENRPSYQVASYMLEAGYKIIPVNPGHSKILGQTCYPDLCSIPDSVEIVDIFRRSDQVVPFIKDAIEIGAKVIWMQQGIINEEAARIAEQSGLTVIMDRCIKIDHLQLHESNR